MRRSHGMGWVAMSLLLVAAGCTGRPEEFPAGAWWLEIPEQGLVVVLDFRPDGAVMAGNGALGQDPAMIELSDLPEGEASWSAQGDVLSLDLPCPIEQELVQRTDTYRWSVQGDQMTLSLIQTLCPNEGGGLDGAPLTRLESTPAVAGSHADPVAEPVPWWSDEVFYEVFVRSFSDSDGDGNGDLRGLINKLPYLHDLGVTALWLMPIMQSPSYHGYDIIDYYTVEADYGTNADFTALVAAAHARGIEVIVDLVLNHTSVEDPWFADSASGPDSSKRDWYLWRDSDPGTVSWFTGGPAWHPKGGAYYYGFFGAAAPDLNYTNLAVTKQMEDVAEFWLAEMGADGFRMDAIAHLIEDGDQLAGTQQTHDWLAAFDNHVDSIDPHALTVGEVLDTTGGIAGYVTDDEVDLAFEFPLAEQLLASLNADDPGGLARQLRLALATYPPGQFAPFLTNHDQERAMSQLGGHPAKANLAASTLLTLPGVPFVYYGEEIGMTGQKPDEMLRTPMQWNATEHAGFTTGTPWEQVNDDYPTVNVAAQETDPDSLLTRYRTLLGIRAAHRALSLGGLDLLESSCGSVLAFLRRTADGTDTVLVLLNFGTTDASQCTVSTQSSELPAGTLRGTDLLTGRPAAGLTAGTDGEIDGYQPIPTLPAHEAAIITLTR